MSTVPNDAFTRHERLPDVRPIFTAQPFQAIAEILPVLMRLL